MRTKNNIPKPVVIVPTIYKQIAVRIGHDFEDTVNKYLDKGWKVKHINNTHNSSYKLFIFYTDDYNDDMKVKKW